MTVHSIHPHFCFFAHPPSLQPPIPYTSIVRGAQTYDYNIWSILLNLYKYSFFFFGSAKAGILKIPGNR